MTFIEALVKARRLINIGTETYICHALKEIGAHRYVKNIEDQLSPVTSYEGWVCENHPEVFSQMVASPNSHRYFREGRLQWIDHMIKEANEKEYDRLSKWDRLAGLIMPPSAYGLTDYPA